MGIVRKTCEIEVKEAKPQEGVYEVLITVASADRIGDTIDPKGMSLKNYRQNPVVMWLHDYMGHTAAAGIPIGRSLKEKVEDNGIISKFEFLKGDPFVDRIKNAWDQGFLKTASVGFMPIVSEPNEKKGNHISKSELLEWSIIPIPAHPEALRIKAKSAGFENLIETKPEETEDYIRIPVSGEEGKHDGHRIRTIDISQEEGIKALYCGECKKVITYLFSKAQGWTMEKAKKWVKEHEKMIIVGDRKEAIPYKRTPLADEDAEWDAGKEVREAEVEDLKIMCAIIVGDPENKTSYKLPHHRAGGDHACIWNGVRACAAVLMGARGGVNAPAESIAGARIHIGKHYADFDKGELPWEKGISQDAIRDEFDYLFSIVKGNGLKADNIKVAWDLVNEVMRVAGGDMPDDILVKIGAVLNRKNLERLEQIKLLAQEVIDSAKHEELERSLEPRITSEDIIHIVRNEVSKAISKAQGKVN